MKININKKLLVAAGMAIIAVLIVATAVVLVQRFMARPMTTGEQQKSTISDTPQSTTSLDFTTPGEALAAVNGTLNVMVDVKTTDTIDRVEYSINGTVVATLKEVPYNVDIDVKALALGAYTLRAVVVNAAGAIVAEKAVEFTVVEPAKSVKPPAAPSGTSTPKASVGAVGGGTSGGTTGGSTSGTGGSTGGGDSTPGTGTGGGTTPTPTPTPTPPAFGWLLTATNIGLTPHGLSCGSLPLYSGSDKPAAGTIISGKRVDKTLDLSNGNIIIEKSCVRPASVGQGLSLMTTTNLNNCNNNGCPVTPNTVTIRDSEIDGSLTQASDMSHGCALVGIATMQRNYIHHTGSGICMYNTGASLSATIEYNYVHQLRAFGSGANASHNEAFTVRDFPTNSNPARRMNVLNNRFDASSGNDTGAAFIQTYGDDINQVRFEGNLFEGQGYQLGMEAGFGNIYGTAMSSVNNRFSGTGYGPAYVSRNGLSYGWGVWQENYRNNPSATDNKGAVVGAP